MLRRVIALVVLAVAAVGATLPATADSRQPRVVSENPVDWTPHVLDGTVRAVAVVGDTVVVGGDFERIGPADGFREYRQPYLFAFHRRTGELVNFRPRLSGPVYALTPGPDGTVYAAGAFRTVNGVPARGLARLNVSSGELTGGFSARIADGDVRAVALRGSWLYVGGTFTAVGGTGRVALARLDARTGALDGGFNLALQAQNRSRVKVETLAASPDGKRLVIAGTITHVQGRIRAQIALIDTDARAVTGWYTNVYTGACHRGFDTYMRGVDFAPDGAYFVVVTTGRMSGVSRMCDTAARFETARTGDQRPTWVNHTGGDSLYAVSVTGAAVYVGGHQRWLDNPHGNESAGPGAVKRPGIAAIDPVRGKALPWNPTRVPRGVGVRALVATADGLYVGSDTETLGREYHARIGMFPL